MKKSLLFTTLLSCFAVSLVACNNGSNPTKEEGHTHELTHHNAVSGTCTEKGTLEHYSCAGCGKNFSDADGKNEMASIEGEYGPHSLGEEVEYLAPTCTEHGHLAHQECSVCGAFFDLEGNELAGVSIEPNGHAYKYTLTTAPTFEAEGAVQRVCTECSEEAVNFKVLPLPVLSIEGKVITVAPVAGAESYKLVIGDQVEDLELNDGKFTLTQKMLRASRLGVRAVTSSTDYMEVGYSPINFKAVGKNIQANTNWNFEANREPSDLVIGAQTQWNVASPYGNFTNYDWYIVADGEENTCAKVNAIVSNTDPAAAQPNPVGILKDLGGANGAGKYFVKVDVKLSEKAFAMKDKLSIRAGFNTNGGAVAGVSDVSIASATKDSWTTVTIELEEKARTDWTQLQLRIHVSNEDLAGQEDVAVFFDNIKIVNAADSDENLDSLGGPGAGTFSNWDRMDAVRAATGVATNSVAWQFNGTIFVEGSSAGYISIIDETETNRAIKVYNPKECCEWDLVGNTALKTAGVYQMKFDVKLGPDSKLRDLGLRAWSAGGQAIDDYTIDVSSLKVGEWVTLSFNFTTNTVDTTWINLFFWSFADNNLAQSFSLNNYFLFDNIQIYQTQLA